MKMMDTIGQFFTNKNQKFLFKIRKCGKICLIIELYPFRLAQNLNCQYVSMYFYVFCSCFQPSGSSKCHINIYLKIHLIVLLFSFSHLINVIVLVLVFDFALIFFFATRKTTIIVSGSGLQLIDQFEVYNALEFDLCNIHKYI